MIVRRRSPVVEAVQWHKPGDHPAVLSGMRRATCSGGADPYSTASWRYERDPLGWLNSCRVYPGDWIVPDDGGWHVLSPEAFEREYERVG